MSANRLAVSCPVCAELGIEPDHPEYPEPSPGDIWHRQYDPDAGRICQVCGGRGAHVCPGPRIVAGLDRLAGQAGL